jgi:catalase
MPGEGAAQSSRWHGKTVMAVSAARAIFDACVIVADKDPGVLSMSKTDSGGVSKFTAALARHRHPERETDPPVV